MRGTQTFALGNCFSAALTAAISCLVAIVQTKGQNEFFHFNGDSSLLDESLSICANVAPG